MGENKDDVKDESSEEESSPSTDSEEENVDPDSDEENDKDKNFSALRKKNKSLEEENKELKEKNESLEETEGDRNLEKDDEDDPEKDKKEKPSDVDKKLFDRDMKKAVRNWNSKNKVSKEEWAKIKDKVSFEGNEDDDQIYEKINDAYSSLPGVREKREKELKEEGKKEAMNEFQDSEMDFGGGGDIDHGGTNEPRFTQKEKSWLKTFGVTKEEQKKIDKSSTSHNDWEILDPEYK